MAPSAIIGANTPLNFNPYGSLKITATTAAGGVTGLFTTQSSIGANSVLIYNAGTVEAFVAFGQTTATAAVPGTSETQGGLVIPPGAIVVVAKGTYYDAVAAITASSTAILYLTAGEGV